MPDAAPPDKPDEMLELDPGTPLATDQLTRAALPIPDHWEQVDAPAGVLAIAASGWPDGVPGRPNLTVVASAAPPGLDAVQQVGLLAMAEIRRSFADVHLISYDAWRHADDKTAKHRRLSFTYRADELGVLATQWLILGNRIVTTITCTCSPFAAAAVGPIAEICAGYAHPAQRLPTSSESIASHQEQLVSEWPRDPYLAARGEQLEDLTAGTEAQPFGLRGPTLRRQGVFLLHGMRRKPAKVKRLQPDDREQLDRLVAAELADADGALTPHGRAIADLLHRSEHGVRIEATDGRAAYTFTAHTDSQRAVVLATGAPSAAVSHPPASAPDAARIADTFALDLVHLDWLPALIARWLGIGPAWSLATHPKHIPYQAFTARLDDPSAPPPDGADANLQQVWAQSWYLWRLTTPGPRPGLAMIRAGRRGHFTATVDPTREHAEVISVPTAVLWQEIIDQVRGLPR